MRRPFLIGLLGTGLVGLLGLSIGSRASLHAQQSAAIVSSNVVGGAFSGANKDEPTPKAKLNSKPMTSIEAKIWLKLQDKVAMAFANETSLEDLMKHVQSSTVDKVDFPEGIPVYFDPQGLQDADKTTKSTISLDLKGIPLATTLKLALKQLSLDFWVHPDGLLIVTYEDSEEIPVDAGPLILDELAALRREVKALRDEVRLTRGMEPLSHDGPSGPKPTPAMGALGGMR